MDTHFGPFTIVRHELLASQLTERLVENACTLLFSPFGNRGDYCLCRPNRLVLRPRAQRRRTHGTEPDARAKAARLQAHADASASAERR
jgi:hypothetical protein